MKVDIAWWDLADSAQTIAALREHLRSGAMDPWAEVPGLRLKLWVTDVAWDRWGAIMIWDSGSDDDRQLPPNLAAELIGRPPDHRLLLDVDGVAEGARGHA